jgi:hypothetical protein
MYFSLFNIFMNNKTTKIPSKDKKINTVREGVFQYFYFL